MLSLDLPLFAGILGYSLGRTGDTIDVFTCYLWQAENRVLTFGVEEEHISDLWCLQPAHQSDQCRPVKASV